MKYEELYEGQSVTDFRTISQRDVDDFIHLTGDNNYVHIGENAIVHGILLESFISMLIGMKLPGPGSIWIKHDTVFIQPVRIGDELEMTISVSKKLDHNRVMLEVDMRNKNNDYILASMCLVKVP